MIATYHVVDPTEQSPAIVPLARDHRIVLCFVPCAVLLTGEAALRRLWTAVLSTEQRLRVSFVVLAQIAGASEARTRRAAWPGAGPAAVRVLVAVVCYRAGIGRNASGDF